MNYPVLGSSPRETQVGFTRQLLAQTLQSGALDPASAQAFSVKLLEIFKEALYRYTLGESSTLRMETGQQLMDSILFTIDLYLSGLSSSQTPLEQLAADQLSTLYDRALAYLKNYVQDTQSFYQTLEVHRIYAPNLPYQETFTKAIPGFFKNYDLYFGAHLLGSGGEIDYPLLWHASSASGVVFIREYLEVFSLENEFCSRFYAVDINNLLKAYGRFHRINYQLVPINLVELVFGNVLFLTLLNKPYSPLFLSETEILVLEAQLKRLKPGQIETLLTETLFRMIKRLKLSDGQLLPFLEAQGKQFIQRVLLTLPQVVLKNLVITKPARTKGGSLTDLGQKMNNQAFRQIYQRICAATGTEEKIGILLEATSSLEDFIDLLQADCFWDEEYLALFQALDKTTLSILTSHGLGRHSLDPEGPVTQLIKSPPKNLETWEKWLIHWLSCLPGPELASLEQQVLELMNQEMI